MITFGRLARTTPPTLDELCPSVIDAWLALDGKEGDALTQAEDALQGLAIAISFTILERQCARGIISRDELAVAGGTP